MRYLTASRVWIRGAVCLALLGMLVSVSLAVRPHATAAGAADAAVSSGVVVSPSGKVLSPATGAYCGVFRVSGPNDGESFAAYNAMAGKAPAIVMSFKAWDISAGRSFNEELCAQVLDHGAVPLITWEPWNPGGDPNYLSNPAKQPAYSLSRINAGAHDSYIREWAREIKALGRPVMLRPMHEMNGTWYPWGGTVNGNSPAAFRAAWKRIHRLFAEEGATNVSWVWSINWESGPNTYENRFAAYYPGDAYVDWTSISGYNWGTTRTYSRWMTFEQIYAKPLAYLESVGKPIILSEFGSVTRGGDKAAWLTDAYARIKAHPKIKGVIYYDKREVGLKGDQDWQATNSWQTWRAYRTVLKNPYYVGGVAP